MSMSRLILPGATHFVDRRCVQRRFRLRPDPHVNDVFHYCLALAATEFDIPIHAFEVLSNHYHQVLTDPSARLPDFEQRLNMLLARAINAYRGRTGYFFEQGSYGDVALETPEDVLDKIVYTLANPVAAGIVPYARQWTGASSLLWSYGETRTFKRPDGPFFGPRSKLPKEVRLTLTVPPCFGHLSNEEFGALVDRSVHEREEELHAEFRAQGRGWVGMSQVMHRDPEDSPDTVEPRGKMNPRVAGKDRSVRVEAIRRLQEFRRAYRAAWLKWRDGDHSVVFPAGTYLMRVRHNAACEAPS